MSDIVFPVTISCTPDAVYAALTDPATLRRWWTASAEGTAVEGATLSFGFSDGSSLRMLVQRLMPGVLVQWLCTDETPADGGWRDTRVFFEIHAGEDGGVRLDFAHRHWPEGHACFAACADTWRTLMHDSLKPYLETGSGKPDRGGGD